MATDQDSVTSQDIGKLVQRFGIRVYERDNGITAYLPSKEWHQAPVEEVCELLYKRLNANCGRWRVKELRHCCVGVKQYALRHGSHEIIVGDRIEQSASGLRRGVGIDVVSTTQAKKDYLSVVTGLVDDIRGYIR